MNTTADAWLTGPALAARLVPVTSRPVPTPKSASAGASLQAASAVGGSTCDLRKGQTLTIERPQGQAVLCTHGALWITCEPGSAGADETGMRLKVHALTDACVSVLASAPAGPAAGAPDDTFLR